MTDPLQPIHTLPPQRVSLAPATAPATPAIPPDLQQRFDRNKAYLAEGEHTYNTKLPPAQEEQFREWLQKNNVPFDPNATVADYDMRGFWGALQVGDERAKSAINPNDKALHYPDYWKTPYHESFSGESRWAGKNAPKWNDQDQLVAPDGTILFDEKAQKQ